MKNNLGILSGLIKQEIKSKYYQNLFGAIWAVVHPITLFSIYYFIFYKLLSIRLPLEEKSSFMPFLAIGLWPWLVFSDSVNIASSSIIDQKDLLSKIKIEPWILLISKGASALAIHLSGFLIIIAILYITNGLNVSLLSLTYSVLLVICIAIFSCGFWMLLGSLRVFFRDIGELIQPLLLVWFLLTPILYSKWIIPESYRDYFLYNPMAYYIDELRSALLEDRVVFTAEDGMMIIFLILFFLISIIVYRKSEPWFEDFL